MGDSDMAALKAAQKLLDGMTGEILQVVKEFVGKQASTREVLNGQIDASKQLVQRIVCTECHDFKIVTKLPLDQFGAWESRGFEPEARFLKALGEIEGISEVATQTYTLEVVNLMGKIKVPKASEGCMADALPTAA